MRRKEIAEARKTYRDCRVKSPQVGKPKDIEITHTLYDSHKSRVVPIMTCPTVEDMGISNPRSRAEARDVGKATVRSLQNLENICATTMCATCIYKGAGDRADIEFIRTRLAESLAAIADQTDGDDIFSLDTQSAVTTRATIGPINIGNV